MAAPITIVTPMLAPGMFSIIGTPSIYGFTCSNNMAFGVIHEMSSNNTGSYSVGQNVLIPYNDNLKRLTYSNQEYWLVAETEIYLVEIEEEDIS